MSRKKKEQRNDDKLQKIYDEEPAMPMFFNERRAEPRPFKKGEDWFCGRIGCMSDNAMLWRLSDGRCICGHCYYVYNL